MSRHRTASGYSQVLALKMGKESKSRAMERTLEDFEKLVCNFSADGDGLHFPPRHSFLGAAWWPSLARSCGVARLRGSVRRRSCERATLPRALLLRRVEDPSRADTARNSTPWAQHNPHCTSSFKAASFGSHTTRTTWHGWRHRHLCQ